MGRPSLSDPLSRILKRYTSITFLSSRLSSSPFAMIVSTELNFIPTLGSGKMLSLLAAYLFGLFVIYTPAMGQTTYVSWIGEEVEAESAPLASQKLFAEDRGVSSMHPVSLNDSRPGLSGLSREITVKLHDATLEQALENLAADGSLTYRPPNRGGNPVCVCII